LGDKTFKKLSGPGKRGHRHVEEREEAHKILEAGKRGINRRGPERNKVSIIFDRGDPGRGGGKRGRSIEEDFPLV